MGDQSLVDKENQRSALWANAGRLLTDAAYLAQAKRCESAIGLATLGLEEVGKSILHRWYEGQPSPKNKESYHVRKQLAFVCLLLAQEAVTAYGKDVGEEATKEFGLEMARVVKGTHIGGLLAIVSLGKMDGAKQMALYRDVEKACAVLRLRTTKSF